MFLMLLFYFSALEASSFCQDVLLIHHRKILTYTGNWHLATIKSMYASLASTVIFRSSLFGNNFPALFIFQLPRHVSPPQYGIFLWWIFLKEREIFIWPLSTRCWLHIVTTVLLVQHLSCLLCLLSYLVLWKSSVNNTCLLQDAFFNNQHASHT